MPCATARIPGLRHCCDSALSLGNCLKLRHGWAHSSVDQGLLYPPRQAERQLISIPHKVETGNLGSKGLTVGGDHEHTFEI
jgi:hypothetical protein